MFGYDGRMESNWLGIGATLLLQALFAMILWRRLGLQLPLIARRVGYALLACQVLLVLLYGYSRSEFVNSVYTQWLLDLNAENNLPATFSTVQILMLVSVGGTNALFTLRNSRGLFFFWITLSLGFYVLALDEYFALHESSPSLVPIYRVGGGLFFLGMSYWAWRAKRTTGRLIVLLPIGLVISTLGALVVDSSPYSHIGGWQLWNIPLEEGLEMLGMLLALLGALGLLGSAYRPRNWRRASVIFLSLFLMFIVMFGAIILAPRVELKYFGQRTHIEFLDGALWLRGYRLPDAAVAPGEPFTTRLYFGAAKPIFRNDGVSLHLVDQETRSSIAAADRNFPTLHWHRIIGRTNRQSLTLDIPSDFPINRAFWLVLTLWHWDDEAYSSLTISTSDHQQLSGTQVVLREFVIPAPPSSAPSVSLAEFENGFALIAAELPESARAGEALAIPFTWRVTNESTEDWTQFLHFVHEETDTLWNHDQQPLGARLPTRLWYEGLRDTETWQFMLPAELPPGRYAVYTGLYRLSDLARLPVSDADGMPLPDARVPLNYITISE